MCEYPGWVYTAVCSTAHLDALVLLHRACVLLCVCEVDSISLEKDGIGLDDRAQLLSPFLQQDVG